MIADLLSPEFLRLFVPHRTGWGQGYTTPKALVSLILALASDGPSYNQGHDLSDKDIQVFVRKQGSVTVSYLKSERRLQSRPLVLAAK